MSLTIRPATTADTPTVARFIRALAEYERMSDDVVFTLEGLEEELFGPRSVAEVVLAELDGEAVGFALFFHNFSTFLGRRGIYLEDLFVFPEHRGNGIGKALLRHLAKIAVDRRCGRLEWSVLDWNEPSIGFYRSLGAVPMDEWTVFRLSGAALAEMAE